MLKKFRHSFHCDGIFYKPVSLLFLLRDKSDEAYFSLLCIMLSLKFAVIFYQLIKGDGTVAVQIHTGI